MKIYMLELKNILQKRNIEAATLFLASNVSGMYKEKYQNGKESRITW